MKQLNIALLGYKFMGKAHSYALMATPFFFKTGIQPVRKVIVGRNEGPLKQAAENFGWEEYSTDWREVVRRDDIDAVSIGIAWQKQCFRPAIRLALLLRSSGIPFPNGRLGNSAGAW